MKTLFTTFLSALLSLSAFGATGVAVRSSGGSLTNGTLAGFVSLPGAVTLTNPAAANSFWQLNAANVYSGWKVTLTNGAAGISNVMSSDGWSTMSGGFTNRGNLQAATINTPGLITVGTGNLIGNPGTRIYDIANFSSFIEIANSGGYSIEPTATITGSANAAGIVYDLVNGGLKAVRVNAGSSSGLTNFLAGSITAGLTVASTNGFASFSPTAAAAIASTGWTNIWSTNNATVYVTATAVAFTIKDRSAATLYTSPTLTATISVNLQPGWSVNSASGLAGTALPW